MSWLRAAPLGVAAWLLVQAPPLDGLLALGTIERLLLLGPLVAFPLGLSCLPPDELLPARLLPWVWAPGALLAVASFAFPQGTTAAALAVPWLAVTGLAGLLAAGRVLRRRALPVPALAADAALAFLPVGGGWLVLSRAGATPGGFSDVIVLLTAAHFHFAGWAAPLAAGSAAAWLDDRPGALRTIARLAALGAVAGPPAVAVGITAGRSLPALEGAIAVAFALAMAALALVLVAGVGPRLTSGPRILVTLAGVALLAGMGFAAVYGVSRAVGATWVDIPTMARLHGTLNALGLGVAGLAGLALEAQGARGVTSTPFAALR